MTLSEIVKVANELDSRGLHKEADYLDRFILKSAWSWRDITPDFVETSVDYWADNSVADAYQDVSEEIQDVGEVARAGGYGDTVEYWADHGVQGGVEVFLEESFDALFSKFNEWAREEYAGTIARGGEGIVKHIAASIPAPLGSHTFGGGNHALTWTSNGIGICGLSLQKLITRLTRANTQILGFVGVSILEPLYNEIEKLINQYPVILYAVDYIQGYNEYATWIQEKTGLRNFDYESLLWNHLTSPLHEIKFDNGVPIIAEVGQYCDLINNPTDRGLINAAVNRIAAQTGQTENLEQATEMAKNIFGPRLSEWQKVFA